MRCSIPSFAAALALVSSASATIFITEPVATTSCMAGQVCNVRWSDDGAAPVLAQIGPCSISLYTGGAQQQTKLQDINPSIDVSTNSFVSFTPDAKVGPSGSQYFIRFESLSLKDATNPQFPYQSFSAKFTLNGMTGTFTPEIQAQIDGTSAATSSAGGGIVIQTTTAARASSAAASSAAGSVTSKAAATSAASSARATTTNSANGAVAAVIPGVVGSLAGVTIATVAAGFMFGMVALGL